MSEFEKYVVLAEQKRVIDQQLDHDAAFGGSHEVIEDHGPHRVERPQKGLQVDALGGAVDGAQPPVEGAGAVVEQRIPVPVAFLGERLPESRVGGGGRVLRRQVHGLQRAAGGREHGCQHEKRSPALFSERQHGAECNESV